MLRLKTGGAFTMAVRSGFYTFHRSNAMSKARLFFGILPFSGIEYGRHFSKSSSVFFIKPNNDHNRKNGHQGRGLLLLGVLTASAGGYFLSKRKTVFAKEIETIKPGEVVENLPFFTQSDVALHTTKEKRIWVTYKNGVYDVTDFVDKHPGGSKILLAAGSSLEPFWAIYGSHHTEEVYRILEEYRIGNTEYTDQPESSQKPAGLYEKEPVRHPLLRPASVAPYNAEPPPSLLVDKFHTPNEIFFVRNHLPVPEVDITNYRLEISGIGLKNQSLTLEDLKKFPKHTVTAALQCAGNRRSEMTAVKPVKGLNWGHAAIGNATWSGAKLTDVLKTCGLDLNRSDIQHVQFEGLDQGPDKAPYGASIPSENALDPRRDVLLAYEMNGEPLPRDHGYPVRVVVPGVVGARNVKWLSRIILSDQESPSHWQQNDYKGFSPSTDWDNVDFKTSPAIQELPVISAICMPENGEKVDVDDGHILCRGYAWSGGGRRIVRVDVSVDEGRTWHVADLEQSEEKAPRHWGWTLWSAYIPVPERQQKVEIWAKAVDSSYNTQPERFENIWNLRGVLSNAYHKINVNVKNRNS